MGTNSECLCVPNKTQFEQSLYLDKIKKDNWMLSCLTIPIWANARRLQSWKYSFPSLRASIILKISSKIYKEFTEQRANKKKLYLVAIIVCKHGGIPTTLYTVFTCLCLSSLIGTKSYQLYLISKGSSRPWQRVPFYWSWNPCSLIFVFISYYVFMFFSLFKLTLFQRHLLNQIETLLW